MLMEAGGVLRSQVTLSAISRRLTGSSFLRRPPMRPSARAAARPADVRSRIMARSNSAKAPTICIIPVIIIGGHRCNEIDRVGSGPRHMAFHPDRRGAEPEKAGLEANRARMEVVRFRSCDRLFEANSRDQHGRMGLATPHEKSWTSFPLLGVVSAALPAQGIFWECSR
jgi:hypothetical protein